ncbi:MAG: MBL fold metallo-hydrolase, partial [Candidatus Omnitrophica bacterium]|nr:MBL fold metallo-hydrolase [Candidatus Omnitrophota bacterium]
IKNLEIKAVYAYNLHKQFHPKSEDNLGYILTLQDSRIYHAGDTDFIPEMQEIKADICLLPIGGTYTMDVKEALKAVETILPKLVIPMHWGEIIGSKKDAEDFVRLCKIQTRILEKV